MWTNQYKIYNIKEWYQSPDGAKVLQVIVAAILKIYLKFGVSVPWRGESLASFTLIALLEVLKRISPLTGRKSCKSIIVASVLKIYLKYQSPDGAKVLQDYVIADNPCCYEIKYQSPDGAKVLQD